MSKTKVQPFRVPTQHRIAWAQHNITADLSCIYILLKSVSLFVIKLCKKFWPDQTKTFPQWGPW